MGSPKAAFDAQAFDDSFFATYEKQLSDISKEEQASLALANILTIERDDGNQKSYEQIRNETQAFFASDYVRNDEAIMRRIAMEFAQACMEHSHGAELAQDNQLGLIFEKGVDSLFGDGHDHKHDDHAGEDNKDDELDTKTGKKKKKRYRGWLSILFTG
jgi:hypothetical protein